MAIRDRGRTRVCILNPEEAARFESSGERPNCRCHPHISRAKAEELTSTMLFVSMNRRHYEAYYVGTGKKAMVFHDSREWRKGVSGGYAVMQQVPGGGVR
jgi:hypothetical protein